MQALLIRTKKEQDKFFILDGAKSSYMIGRGNDVDILLSDNQISRHHAEIKIKEGQWVVVDKNSRNGTLANGKKIDEISLNSCDAFSLGNSTVYVFEMDPQLSEELNVGVIAETTLAPTSQEVLKITSSSPSMMKVMDQVLKVSRFDITVHITGETGCGKEVVAQAIANISPRRDAPFVRVNCGAISEDLIDSEFFGHVKGAFTGADKDRMGLFVEAEGGTLFLDEIGELSASAQTKLLRAIENKSIRPVGATENISVNIRIISATHLNLEERVKEGLFREDLFYRLNVFTIDVPPLRKRKRDIPQIVEDLMAEIQTDMNESKTVRISEEAITVIKNNDWPGNIRQLKNVLESAIVLSNDVIEASDICISESDGKNEQDTFQTLEALGYEQFRKHILKALDVANGNKSKSAKILGISRASLYEKLKLYDID